MAVSDSDKEKPDPKRFVRITFKYWEKLFVYAISVEYIDLSGMEKKYEGFIFDVNNNESFYKSLSVF